MPGRWRLVVDGPGDGPWNMGVDEALLATAAAGGPGAATLRLYGWRGPWLSLGYGQSLSPERRAACDAAGVGLVQRVTGGLAVLHGADLTYAIAAPADRLPPGLEGSYALVADALCAALDALGVTVERRAQRPAAAVAREGFDCFAVPARDELLVDGRKLVGSAQRRAGGAVLQHGSLRLQADPADAARAAGLAPGQATSLAELGAPSDAERVGEAVLGAFAQALGVSPEPGVLSSAERAHAERRSALPPARAASGS